MMSSVSTSRASRSSKEKNSKSQPTSHNVKGDGPSKGQLQPTADQMRLAQMISDRNDAEDPELQNKVQQVMELTGRSKDAVIVALHDCDSDPNRAINMLLEGGNDQGEWQESVKKRKRNQAAPKTAETAPTNTRPDRREKSHERDREDRQENGPPSRSSRGGRPPRLSRGGGNFRNRNENTGDNERNRGESGSRERGRGRGRGHPNGPGRGRGRGGRGFRSNRFEKGPQIDTWTNETAENAEKENTIGDWGDSMAEDWTADEWTGSLEESKVFTPSMNTESNKMFPGVGDNDAQMFTPPPMQVESQVFSAGSMGLGSTNSTSPALNDATNTLHSGSPLQQNSLTATNLSQTSIGQNSLGNQNSLGGASNSLGSQNAIGSSSSYSGSTSLGQGSLTQNALGQGTIGPSSLGQSSLGQASLGQRYPHRLDLGMLLKGSAESSAAAATQQQQSQYMSQFAKQATESIKNAVGIGSASTQAPVSNPAASLRGPQVVSQTPGVPVTSHTVQQGVLQQQRVKPLRTKLPPPSKIPASAVEMPGHVGNFQLDVQFGNWDFNATESSNASSGFSFGGSDTVSPTSNYNTSNSVSSSGGLSNHLPSACKTSTEVTASGVGSSPVISSVASSNKQGISAMDSSLTGGSPSVFQNSTPSPVTTPSKDYSQANKMSSPDNIPYQGDRKTSPHYSQRSSVASSSSVAGQLQASSSDHADDGSLNKPTSSPQMTNYNYTSSGYSNKPSSSTSSSYSTHGPADRGSGNSSLQNQYNHQYQGSSSFQSPGSNYSPQNQGSTLYQSPGSQSGYQNQASNSSSSSSSSSSYQNQTNSAYQSQPSSSPSAYSSQTNSYTSQSYHSSRESQRESSGSNYPTTVSQSGSSYQSGQATSSTYNSSTSQSSSSSYQRGGERDRDSQSGGSGGFSSHQNYSGSNSMQSAPLSTSKLSDSLSKMSVKDSALDQSGYDQHSGSSSTSSASLTTTTSTTSSSMAAGTVSVASTSLGLNSTTPSVSTTTSLNSSTSSKSSLPLTTKAPPNLPPGVPPLIGPNYMIGQHGMPFAAAAAFSLQQPAMYYEDLQMLQQRLPLPGYYDMQFQPSTTLPGRDQNTLTSVPYTAPDQKMTRVDAQSPVQAQSSQQQQQQQQQPSQQQAFLNPLPPGYNYYYPSAAGLLPGGYSFTPQVFPVPSVTNAAAHGGTTANAQFQKPGGYGSHGYGAGYDDLSSQGQELAKAYAGSNQTQAKVSVGSVSVTSSGTDLTGASYGKTHNPSYDKAAGFHAGTPPPFNLPLPTGTQAGAMAAPTAAYGTPYVPVMPHQPPSQLLHHHLQQVGCNTAATNLVQ